MRTNLIWAVVLMAGCTSDEAPSCQQAVSHYYASGCKLFDPATGNEYSEGVIIASCKQELANASGRCLDALDDLNSCMDSTPTPAKSNADCDCSQEQDAYARCK